MAQVKALVDKLLTNVSNGIFPVGYISEMLLPKIQVVQQSGKIGKHGKGHLRILNTVGIGKGKSAYVDSEVTSSNSYYIDTHRLKTTVTMEDYRNVEKPFDAEKNKTDYVTTHLWLGKEKALADALADTAVLTQNTTLSGNAQFNDYANSDPLGKAKTARHAVRAGCGLAPNVAWMDWYVADTLRYHPGILEALGYTMNRAGQLSDQELAKALGVRKLLIAEAVYNTSKEGQTDALGAVWGKHMWFGYIPDAPGLDQQSLGYHLSFAGTGSRTVYKEPQFDPPGATDVLVTDDYDQLLSDVTCAYLIKNAIA